MKLNNLKAPIPNKKNRKRVGRGEGSGLGQESGRGMNGAKSRSGYSKKIGFEGGQMPLQRRIPKYGFKNFNRTEYQVINLDVIQKLAEDKKLKSVLNLEQMAKLRLIHKNDLVKILGRGKLAVPIKVSAHKFSASAKKAIEAAGGEAITI